MPDVLNRESLERKLARVVSRENRSQLDQLLEYLGDPPLLENVPIEFWENGGRALRGVVVPVFLEVYLSQAEGLMQTISIGVDWALINEGAVEWAKQYSFELISGITETTRKGVSKAITAFYDTGLTIGDLESTLLQYYGPVRSEMIAVTEVTRASVEGERAIANQIMQDNPSIMMVPYWITNDDEIVHECPICWPRHQQEITDGVYPPAHPRCRCWVNHDMRVND